MSSWCGLSMAEEEEEDKRCLESQFAAAVKVIRSLPEEGHFQPSDDMMLMFYSYYKQATLGPCDIPRPTGFWDTRGKAKWDAWSALGNMTKEEAMKNYIADIQLILETIPISEEVSDLIQKLGNFYTEVEQDDEEAGETEKRPFTRPFAHHSDGRVETFKRPTMEGYGDLWDEIQNLQERDGDSIVHGSLSGSSEEAVGSRENSEVDMKVESSDLWRSEEEETGDDEDNTYNGDEEDERDCSPDRRLLMVEDRRWRSDTKGSSSSVEPSMSSFTNGTHSSLNSEVEEEELAYSIEPDHRDVVPEKNLRSTDSDNEEFCDSMEHLAMEEQRSTSKGQSPGSEATSVKQRDLWFESNTTPTEIEDQVLVRDSCFKEGIISRQHNSSWTRRVRGSDSPPTACSPVWCLSVDTACSCVSHSRYSVGGTSGHINEQIATALLRLQQDMDNVLHRLQTLEVLTRSQSRSSSPCQEVPANITQKFLRPSWWPFDVSPFTVMMTALWPLIAHLLIQLYLQRKRRKVP